MKQPNQWSCLPTSLAILLDKPFDEIIRIIGHDGSERVEGYPFNRRCFHDSEVIYAAYQLGVHLVPFLPYLEIPGRKPETLISSLMFKRILEQFSGLILAVSSGQSVGHALAWKDGRVHDPKNAERMTYGRFNERYNVEVFYAWVNRPQGF